MIFVNSDEIKEHTKFLSLIVNDKTVNFCKEQNNIYLVVLDKNNETFLITNYDTIEHFNNEKWDLETLRNSIKNFIENYTPKSFYNEIVVSNKELECYLALLNMKNGSFAFKNHFKEIPNWGLSDFSFEIKTPSFFNAMKNGIPSSSEKYIFAIQKNMDDTISPKLTWHDTSYILKKFNIERIIKDLEAIVKNEKNVEGYYKISRGYNVNGTKNPNDIYIGKTEFEKSVHLLKESPNIQGLMMFREHIERNRVIMKKEWINDKDSFIISENGYVINSSIPYDQLPGNAIVYVSKEDVYCENGQYLANNVYVKNDLKTKDTFVNFINQEGENVYDLQK